MRGEKAEEFNHIDSEGIIDYDYFTEESALRQALGLSQKAIRDKLDYYYYIVEDQIKDPRFPGTKLMVPRWRVAWKKF